MKRLALTGVYKNEETTILKVIKSVEDVVDEFIIGIDDKTKDKTHQVLDDYLKTLKKPYQLIPFTWENDFSKARNLILDHVTSDWVIVLDGDEWLKDSSKQIILDFKKTTVDYDGIECYIYMNPDKYGIPACAFYFPRIAKTKYRWKNPSHNILDIPHNVTQKNKNIILCHSRAEKKEEFVAERSEQRDNMNIDNLLKNVKDNPSDPRAIFYLANTYREMSEFENAIKWYNEYIKIAVWNEEIWECYYNLATCYRSLKDYGKAINSALKASGHDQRRIENLVLVGDIFYHDNKDFEKAFKYYYDACFNESGEEIEIPYDCSLFVNHRVYAIYRWDALSMACSHVGRYNDAIRYARKVLDIEKDNNRIKGNIGFWENNVKKSENKTGTVLFIDKQGTFSVDIINHFKKFYDVEIRRNYDGQLLDGYKFVWFEWCDEHLIKASKRKHNTTIIVRFHSYEYFSNFHMKINWNNIDKIIFVANHVYENVLDDLKPITGYYDKLIEDSKIITNGVNLEKFSWKKRKRGTKLAFYGYFNHKKNLPLTIQLLMALPRKYCLYLIGEFQDPYFRNYFEQYIKIQSPALYARLHLHPWTKDINKTLDELDIDYIISPSLFEGFGYHIAESMAKGIKPVIFHRQGVHDLWPSSLIALTIKDAVKIIEERHYDSKFYRDYIEQKFDCDDKLRDICDFIL